MQNHRELHKLVSLYFQDELERLVKVLPVTLQNGFLDQLYINSITNNKFYKWLSKHYPKFEHDFVKWPLQNHIDMINNITILHNKNQITPASNYMTVESLINQYCLVIVDSDKQKFIDLINDKQSKTRQLLESNVGKKRKRHFSTEDLDKTSPSKKLKTSNPHKLDILNDIIWEKMVENEDFARWVDQGHCFRSSNTRSVKKMSLTGFGKLERQTCEPNFQKLVRESVLNNVTFTQLVVKFNYYMSRIDKGLLINRLKFYYPDADDDVLNKTAIECVNRFIHPDDYDFTLKEDMDEWNNLLELYPNTLNKMRKSERLKNGKRIRIY